MFFQPSPVWEAAWTVYCFSGGAASAGYGTPKSLLAPEASATLAAGAVVVAAAGGGAGGAAAAGFPASPAAAGLAPSAGFAGAPGVVGADGAHAWSTAMAAAAVPNVVRNR